MQMNNACKYCQDVGLKRDTECKRDSYITYYTLVNVEKMKTKFTRGKNIIILIYNE